ncbi:conserved hypothetical protein [Nitrospira lenta]|uniref:DUF1653 domain-containing protein n=1 Tax=Nitrospira lenta TaxID=1436998 RepID=A0A330L5J6_9BACT|nr:DUF1653 domain-containing protein [Nitrospira lenta]SPP64600.1 conserved hypothetical protein [Nitrospira lenta]
MIQPGRYRHYKGNDYEVVGVAKHSETEEEVVVYHALYGEKGLWVRPLAMFLDTVTVEGQPQPRFQFVAEGPIPPKTYPPPFRPYPHGPQLLSVRSLSISRSPPIPRARRDFHGSGPTHHRSYRHLPSQTRDARNTADRRRR